MHAGRLVVRAKPETEEVTVLHVRAKSAGDSRAVKAASACVIREHSGTVHVDVPQSAGRGRTPQVMVEIHVPEGANVDAETGEGEIVCTGEIGDLRSRTTSGSVHAEGIAGKVDAKTARGPITIHRLGGRSVISASDAGVIVRTVDAPLKIVGRAGDVTIWTLESSAAITTSTGNVTVGRLPDRPIHLELETSTGRVDSALPNDPTATETLLIKTVTGDIHVDKARRRF